MQNSYNATHWDKQITKYLSNDWSLRPSPFAVRVRDFFDAGTASLLELGTGAGQDGLWFAQEGSKTVLTDGTDAAFHQITERAQAKNITNFELKVFDITEPFPFEDGSFDVVYAQLVLHYFDDETMHQIMSEIQRVLKQNGLLAVMVNTVTDAEYSDELADDQQIIIFDGLPKRYFSVKTLQPFVASFEPLVFDDTGRTPKDDVVGNSGMIQFIGKKKGS